MDIKDEKFLTNFIQLYRDKLISENDFKTICSLFYGRILENKVNNYIDIKLNKYIDKLYEEAVRMYGR